MLNKLLKLSRWLFILLVCVLISLALEQIIDRHLPDAYNPFEPLSINDEITFLTQQKIRSLKSDQQACYDVLTESDLKFKPLPDQVTGESCGLYNTALLEQSDISYGGGITLKCPALVSLAIWEKHGLKPLADKILQQEVVRIRHYGTYACRNVNNRKEGRRSQHAYANAIDVAGFVLKDGSEISVLKDWGKDTNKGQFLKAIHNSACQYFSTVLGPNYNAAHNNHFHFDQGPYSICR